MMISRTIGYQEKRAKHSTPPTRNPYAERLRRSLGLSECGLLLRAPPVPAWRLAGREPGVCGSVTRSATAAVRQDLVHCARRAGQQLRDIGVRVGEHREHNRVKRLVERLIVRRLAVGLLVRVDERRVVGLVDGRVLVQQGRVGGPGGALEHLRLVESDRYAVSLVPRQVVLALAQGQVLEVDPLDAGLDLGGGVPLRKQVVVAAGQRAGRGAADAWQRAHSVVVDVAAVDRHDHVVDVVRCGDVHAELAGRHLLLQRAPAESLRRAHGLVGKPQGVQRVEHLYARAGVEARGSTRGVGHRATVGVQLRGEVPATVVVGAVVAVTVDAVAELGDRHGVRLHLGPGGGRGVGVQAGLCEQLPVDNQALGVVEDRQPVERAARGDRLHRARHDVLEDRHRGRVDVLGDVGGLASVERLVQVPEVDLVDVRFGAGGQLGGERRRDVALSGVDALDGDVGVGLLERGDVLVPLFVRNGRGRGWSTEAVNGDVACARSGGPGGGAAARARCDGGETESRGDGDPGYLSVTGPSVEPSVHRRSFLLQAGHAIHAVENIDGSTYFWRLFIAISQRNIARTQLDHGVANPWPDLGIRGLADIYCVAVTERERKYARPFGRKLPNAVGQIMQILAFLCRIFAA